jgi:hypothetical protein
LIKGSSTYYPIRYNIWQKKKGSVINGVSNWAQVNENLICFNYEANPLRGSGGRWSIMPVGEFSSYQTLDSEDKSIQGRKGIITDLNGCYFIELLGRGRLPNTVRFTNQPSEGQKPVDQVTKEIELDLVYPLIKGAANIRAFFATTSSLYAIIPNKRISVDFFIV